jgi:hypothetical protein
MHYAKKQRHTIAWLTRGSATVKLRIEKATFLQVPSSQELQSQAKMSIVADKKSHWDRH